MDRNSGPTKMVFQKKNCDRNIWKKVYLSMGIRKGQTLSVSIGSIRAATSNYKCTFIYVYLDSSIKYNFTGSSPPQKLSMSTCLL